MSKSLTYLLDTNILSDLVRHPQGKVAARITTTGEDSICTSIIAAARHHLARKGTPIGPDDLLIAAHALADDLTVVTANVGELTWVPELKVVNWLQT